MGGATSVVWIHQLRVPEYSARLFQASAAPAKSPRIALMRASNTSAERLYRIQSGEPDGCMKWHAFGGRQIVPLYWI
jgi:hypothetical protein